VLRVAGRDLGVGIIGSGYMGRTYAECVARYNTGARLVAVAGGSRAPSLAAGYQVHAEPSVDDLLARSDVDAVIITSPQSAHCEQTLAAARAGKHVLVEKPMATSSAECHQMIDGCRAAGVELAVIKPWRYRGSTLGLYTCIQNGDIGAVRMISLWWLYPRIPFIGKEWFRDPKEGGLFLDAGSHCFDFMRWVAGAEPTRLFAQLATFNQDSETPRSTMTTVTFANGVMGSLWLSYEVPTPGWENTNFRARVVGETGNLDAHGYGALQLGTGEAWETLYEQAPMDFINRPMEKVRLEAFFAMTQDFIDALRDGRPQPVTGEDGLAAVAMVEAGYRSHTLGQAVDL
jgi:predicted dehydrogenase